MDSFCQQCGKRLLASDETVHRVEMPVGFEPGTDEPVYEEVELCSHCYERLENPGYEPPNCYIPGEGWRLI